MKRSSFALGLVAGWLLVHSAGGRDEWREVSDFGTESQCDYGRTAEVERATLEHIGSALASQPVDNPMRQDAYRRAYDRVRGQYRCVRDDR
jgi:hypothetical protein